MWPFDMALVKQFGQAGGVVANRQIGVEHDSGRQESAEHIFDAEADAGAPARNVAARAEGKHRFRLTCENPANLLARFFQDEASVGVVPALGCYVLEDIPHRVQRRRVENRVDRVAQLARVDVECPVLMGAARERVVAAQSWPSDRRTSAAFEFSAVKG
jgi:hypothetical protein